MILGIIAGILMALTPGLHINLIKDIALTDNFLIAAAGAFLIFNIIQIFVFYTSIPEEIAGLPLIVKLSKKYSQKAIIIYHALGALFGIVFAYLFYNDGMIQSIYNIIKPYFAYILILASLLLIVKSKNRKIFATFFIISGLLGFAVFSSVDKEPFLPLFSGLFSLPLLLIKKKQNQEKEWHEKNSKINIFEIFFSSLVGSFLGFIAILLPSISSPSVISMLILPAINNITYISILSSITSSQYLYGMHSLTEINKPRIGWISGLKSINIELLIVSCFISSILIFLFLNKIKLLNSFYSLRPLAIFYIILLTLLLSGIAGIVALFSSAVFGLFAATKDVEKTSLLGCLTLPTIMNFLF
ncbi:MAG: hypothetical protein QXS91_00585 [Candidatus Anstonellales archaeon]